MPGAISSVFTTLTLIATGIGLCFASPENITPNQPGTQSPVFVHKPPEIQYYVTHNQPANLTWVAMNVCRIQIKCNGQKFKDERRVCGKSCRGCRTRTKTKMVTVADFPKDVRSITCRCRVWGKKAVRQSDLILVDKAFLRRKFGEVQLYYVLPPNTTVVLKCRPPNGRPLPNITWYKIGTPSLLLGHDGRRRIRLTSKKELLIKRVQIGDSGEYQCVARNMAARRVGPVIKLDVGENISTADCQEPQWPCTNQYSPECASGSNRSLICDSEPPVLMVGTQRELYTTDLLNTSTRRHIVAKNVVSLDFGVDPNLIYWTDGNRMNRFSVHNGVIEDMPFGHDDLASVEDLTVDWVGDKIFWIDAMHDGIFIGDLPSGRRVKIIDKNLDSPRAIVVSPSEGYIYWTGWGRTPKIERARLDGTGRNVFITSGIQIPNGLVLDESDKKLYWAGKDLNGYGVIEAVSLDGLTRNVIFRQSGYHPLSLDIFQDFVYWTDWEKNAVLRINKTNGGVDEVIVSVNKPMGLKILHQRTEIHGVNPCEKSNGGCEHLCVYLPSLGSRCLCEQNFELNDNGKTCDKLELQGENSNTSDSNSPMDPSLIVILLIVILLLGALGVVMFMFRKRCRPCQTSQDLKKRSTNPDHIHGDGDESLELTDQTELGRALPDSNNESSNLTGQESGQPSGSVAACGDSLVTSPRGLVAVYGVYVEQHGGVTVVGDDAKVHHHYSSQT